MNALYTCSFTTHTQEKVEMNVEKETNKVNTDKRTKQIEYFSFFKK